MIHADLRLNLPKRSQNNPDPDSNLFTDSKSLIEPLQSRPGNGKVNLIHNFIAEH